MILLAIIWGIAPGSGLIFAMEGISRRRACLGYDGPRRQLM
jgi:hypothetical protein